MADAPTDDARLLRYSRHVLLPEIGVEGQRKLDNAHVLLIGAGGLGSAAALYLASSGVGRLTIIDDDRVDLGNLQRQIVHRTSSVGALKVDSARETLSALNPEIDIRTLAARADESQLNACLAEVDIVVDGCDNFATRHAVNRACVSHRKPLVSGAALGFDGQLAVFDLSAVDAPCYHCIFPETDAIEARHCAENGVFAPLVGVVGALQAAEALKWIVGLPSRATKELLLIDLKTGEWRGLKTRRDPHCLVCAQV